MKGKIVRYLTYRGYGFIRMDGEDRDVFFHNSRFPRNRLPTRGMDMEFKLIETDKGLEARDLYVIDEKVEVEESTVAPELGAGLGQLSGVGPKYMELLGKSNVHNIEELSSYTPEVLFTNLVSINTEVGITKRPPTLSQVENWVEQAASLLQED